MRRIEKSHQQKNRERKVSEEQEKERKPMVSLLVLSINTSTGKKL